MTNQHKIKEQLAEYKDDCKKFKAKIKFNLQNYKNSVLRLKQKLDGTSILDLLTEKQQKLKTIQNNIHNKLQKEINNHRKELDTINTELNEMGNIFIAVNGTNITSLKQLNKYPNRPITLVFPDGEKLIVVAQ